MKETMRKCIFALLWYSQIARLSRLFASGSIVLSYHRVCLSRECGGVSAPALVVSHNRFKKQVQYLKKHFKIKRLSQVVRLPAKREIALSFDDAYLDLKDLLTKKYMHSVPVSIFVPTGYIGRTSGYWWDSLWTSFKKSSYAGMIPLGRRKFRVNLDSDFEATYERIAKYIRSLPAAEQEQTVKGILQIIGDSSQGSAALSKFDLVKIARRSNVELGNHTASHLNIAQSSKKDSLDDFKAADQFLTQATHQRPELFAFPYGDGDAISDSLDNILSKSGYVAAFTLLPGEVRPETPLYRMPRVNVLDEPMYIFKTKLTPIYWWISRIL